VDPSFRAPREASIIAAGAIPDLLGDAGTDKEDSNVIYHDYYADIPCEIVEQFVREQEMGRLVTVGEGSRPHLGLYPFLYAGDVIEVHLVRTDEQMVDLRARARCLFEVDEVLGTIPSYWVHPENAVMATAYHRTVIFDCEATVCEDAVELAAQQTRLLSRYQPEGGFRPLAPDDPLYRGAIAHIAAVRLHVRSLRVKFKLGQNRPAAAREKIVEQLCERRRPNDARAAAALQWTIDREAGR
jgi:predicted FMN-binding regulatory protein PaiB